MPPKFYNPAKHKPREKAIEAAIGRYAVSRGCLWWKFTSPNNRSVPDRLVITPNGVAALLEVKRPGEKLTVGQSEKIQQVLVRQGLADWTDNVEKGKRIIDEWCSLPGPRAVTPELAPRRLCGMHDKLADIW